MIHVIKKVSAHFLRNKKIFRGADIMFTTMFWILAIWFVVNAIWMYVKRDDQQLQKALGWVNVVAVIAGFWTYFGVSQVAGIDTWFNILNYVNIVLAATQLYLGYRNGHSVKHA